MRIKEIFSFENIARMHREIEQLKDVVREMRGYTIDLKEKVRELEKIYFNDSKEYETNKVELSEISKKYEELRVLCCDLLDLYDGKSEIDNSIIKIKYHLMDK